MHKRVSIGEKRQIRPKETKYPLIKLFKNELLLYSILTNKSNIFLQSYTTKNTILSVKNRYMGSQLIIKFLPNNACRICILIRVGIGYLKGRFF